MAQAKSPTQHSSTPFASGDPVVRVQTVNDSAGTPGGAGGLPTGQGKTLLFGKITTAASGATALVAAAGAGLKIKVVHYVLVAGGTVNVKFQSASTDLTGAMPFVANTGVSVAGQASSHVLETAANEALNLNLSAAIQVSGEFSYFVEA